MDEDPNNPPDTYDPFCQANLEYRQGQGQNLHSQGDSSQAANPYANWYIGDLYEETLQRGLYAPVHEALTQILIASDNEAMMRMRMAQSAMSSENSGTTRAMQKRRLKEEVVRDSIKEVAEAEIPAYRLWNMTDAFVRLRKVIARERINKEAETIALACCLKQMAAAVVRLDTIARESIKKQAEAEAGLSS
ncbi:hypothetical protein IQ07DRAFT_600600 [Pyrenochaeta sp. DS3sAY3a]|nr:hypothetical protein IQ07DRAFT_600600 [Pyrenochaeta sp. DS3sAY3a]